MAGTPTMKAAARLLVGVQPTPQGGGLRSTSNHGSSVPTTSQSGRPTASSQHGKSSAPRQSATPATSGGPTDQPSSGTGAGDGPSWYQIAVREAGGEISEPQGPPFPIALAQVRRESVGQIYGRVVGKQPPDSNILSKGLRAYYTRVDLPTLNMWACQTLCIIAEYHMACVT